MVLLESKKHYREDLNLRIKRIKELKNEFENFNEINIELHEFDIDKYCDDLFEYYHQNFKTIPIPSNKAYLFDNILEMAINMYPPFKKGKSDQGFKYAIIYKSLQEFSENNKEYDKFVLVTGDSEFLNPNNLLKRNFFQ